ncbi:hypothetical protein [Sphingomonas sp. Leaf20]|uniref:hypothetical protein n=1 Tax=Sphingomonas sp. Leaf20 TaxID=1735685 RepID=UPI000B31E361|nr:hypothetical protein [Sphingomonas sp. Leaf20]
MGKKKERREREAREREAMQGGTKREGFEARWSAKAGKHGGAAPFAGIAAALTRQMGTPAGRQVIAAGLMMAATAITAKDARGSAPRPPESPQPPTPPTPPTPPVPDDAAAGTGPFAGETPEPPKSDAAALPPEFAKVIDSFASGLERFAANFAKPPKA